MARETGPYVRMATTSCSGEKRDAISSRRCTDSNSTTCEILGPIASAVMEGCDRRRQRPSCASVAAIAIYSVDWSASLKLVGCNEAERALGEKDEGAANKFGRARAQGRRGARGYESRKSA
jgi:hypothetical protein